MKNLLLTRNLTIKKQHEHGAKLSISCLLFLFVLTTGKSFSQTTIIDPAVSTSPNGSFENATNTFAANGWQVVNGATNQWFAGTKSSCVGTKGAYIGTASNNNNYTNTISQVSHFYKDVTFPAGQTCITLSFIWKGGGESTYDGLKVFLGSTGATPVAGSDFNTTDGTAVQLGSTWYNLVGGTCTTVSLTISAANAGTTKRLVFSWKNDGSLGDGVGATVDNISLVSSAPTAPNCATLNSPANGATGQAACNPTISWAAPATSGCNAPSIYYVYFGTATNPALFDSTTTTSYVLGGLNSSTVYYWRIVPKNSYGFANGCNTEFNFTTNTTTCNASPGGAGSANLTTWLKADNAASISGSPVSSWASSGGSPGITLSQATASKRPAINNGATNYRYFSYMPQIGFNATNQTYLSNTTLPSDLVGSTGVIFYIGDREATGITVLTYYYGSNKYQYKPNFRVQTSNDNFNGYTFDFSAPTEYSNLSASEISCIGAGSNQNMRYNSALNSSCSNCNSSTYNPAVTAGYFLGANAGNGEYSNNEVAEIITYNSALTTSQINKIETYLSIKYGITRGGNTGTSSTYNYISSDGTIVWNKTTNTGFNYDIAGIGRDDISGLDKRQSISVNNNEPVTIALNSIATENSTNGTAFSNDKSFLVWGNNGLPCASNYSTTTSNLPSGVQARIQRIWKVQATNFGGTTAGDSYKTTASPLVEIGFETSMLISYTAISNLRVLVDDDGVNWSNATVYSGAALNGSRVEFSGVQFSSTQKFFTLATVNYSLTPLPIELLSFASSCENDKSLIKWQTASETNCSHFDLQKSKDGIYFETIVTINGHGNSSQVNSYEYIDLNASTEQTYYQLKQVDFDNNTHYYNMITAQQCNDHKALNSLSIYPNPADGSEIYLSYSVERDEDVAINIYDVLGKIISSQSMSLIKEAPETKINISDLAKGAYFIKVESTQLSNKALKLIKQ